MLPRRIWLKWASLTPRKAVSPQHVQEALEATRISSLNANVMDKKMGASEVFQTPFYRETIYQLIEKRGWST